MERVPSLLQYDLAADPVDGDQVPRFAGRFELGAQRGDVIIHYARALPCVNRGRYSGKSLPKKAR